MQSLSGYDVTPFPRNPKLGMEQLKVLCSEAADLRGFANTPRMAPEVVPVFTNANGETCGMLPGIYADPVPWIPGDPCLPGASSNGFLPIEEMHRKNQGSNPPANREKQAIVRAALNIAADLANSGKPKTKSEPKTSDKPVEGQNPEGGAPQKPDDAPSLEEHLRGNAATIAAETAVSTLALVMNGAALKSATIMSGLGGSALGMAAAFAYSKLQPDPDDSTAKWAAFVVGPKLVDLFSNGPLDKFWGAQGPYTAPALRVGDKDATGNPIMHGLGSVNIEGLAAARVGDPVGGSGVAVKMGAKTVLIGGQVAARVDKPLTWGSKSCMNSPFLTGATRTYIGGVVNWDPEKDPEGKDRPEIPPSTLEDSSKVPIDKDGHPAGKPLDYGGVHDPKAPQPGKPGIYFDKVTGEYRIWDEYGIGGWSSTLTELSNLPDIGPFRGIFESDGNPTLLNQVLSTVGLADPEQAGHWYVFGGMFDLGSPKFPGAGNGSVWYIPDTIWGIDMSPYYQSHDWTFNPTSATYDGLLGWWDQWLELEWGPYKDGAIEHGWNPVGQLLQFIYTFSTTVIGFMEHSDAEAKRPGSRA